MQPHTVTFYGITEKRLSGRNSNSSQCEENTGIFRHLIHPEVHGFKSFCVMPVK